jgi:hypothetical protein
MYSLTINLTALITLLLLQGCVGVGLRGNVTSIIESPAIGEKGTLYLTDGKSNRVTQESLRARWGEPDEISLVDRESQRWDYLFGYRWNGLGILAVIVPLPLFVPVGREHIYFYFINDEVAHSEIVTDDFRFFAACYLIAIHKETPNCEAGSSQRIVKNKILDVAKP